MSENNGTLEKDNNNFCAVCKIVAKQSCSACKNVYYCSREHQAKDWKSHSKKCCNFKLVEDKKIGLYNVPTRNLARDEHIMTENKSILVTPVFGIGPVCLNCYVPLTIKSAKPCVKCGWPLCHECTTHGPECELTIKYKKSKVRITDYSDKNVQFSAIIILRAIALRNNNHDDYVKLLNLWTALNESSSNVMALRIYYIVAEETKKFIKINDIKIMEMAAIVGIVGLRGFGVQTPKGHLYFAVFDKPSYNAHNCRANSRINTYYDATYGARIVVRTIQRIEKDFYVIAKYSISSPRRTFRREYTSRNTLRIYGKPITLTFTDPLLGTARRRGSLMGSKFVDCKCERCSDPTDLGTMHSAIKCFRKGCKGYMLPPTFLVSEDETIPDYVCDNCTSKIPSDVILRITKHTADKFSRVRKNKQELKNFIATESKILHENHFLIVNAELQLVELFHSRICLDMSEEFAKEMLTISKKLTNVISTLAPDEYAHRGMILCAQYTSMLIICSKLPSSSEQMRMFKEANEVLTEAHRMLRYVNNGEMAIGPRFHLQKIEREKCMSIVLQQLFGVPFMFS